eukprot:808709-Rhodomonas_salina.1
MPESSQARYHPIPLGPAKQIGVVERGRRSVKHREEQQVPTAATLRISRKHQDFARRANTYSAPNSTAGIADEFIILSNSDSLQQIQNAQFRIPGALLLA